MPDGGEGGRFEPVVAASPCDTKADCSPSGVAAPSTNLITDYAYDCMQGLIQYAGGARTDHTIYANDAPKLRISETVPRTTVPRFG